MAFAMNQNISHLTGHEINLETHEFLQNRSWKINANLEISYEIRTSANLFSLKNHILREIIGDIFGETQQIFIDDNVADIYGEKIHNYFNYHNIPFVFHSINASEPNKSLETTLKLLRELEGNRTLRRSAPFLAIGGGVLLDLAGFAASLYRRGVPHIRIPTNLMALVDASIGVKTGVNIWDRRNRLGTYNAPACVLLDRTFLKTVPAREISNGLAEILKLAVIKDAKLFDLLEAAGDRLLSGKLQDDEFSPEIIVRATQGMIEELEPNLWERNLERCVDFGHSFSPLVEMTALPELLHGEAVAMDVLLSCILAARRGMLTDADVKRIAATMRGLGLALITPAFTEVETLWASLEDATLHRDGLQRVPLPNGIGDHVFVNDITVGEVERAIRYQQELAGENR